MIMGLKKYRGELFCRIFFINEIRKFFLRDVLLSCKMNFIILRVVLRK